MVFSSARPLRKRLFRGGLQNVRRPPTLRNIGLSQESLEEEKASTDTLTQEISEVRVLLDQERALLEVERKKSNNEAEARRRLESLLVAEKKKEEDMVSRKRAKGQWQEIKTKLWRIFLSPRLLLRFALKIHADGRLFVAILGRSVAEAFSDTHNFVWGRYTFLPPNLLS